jgi:hypothetical protein
MPAQFDGLRDRLLREGIAARHVQRVFERRLFCEIPSQRDFRRKTAGVVVASDKEGVGVGVDDNRTIGFAFKRGNPQFLHQRMSPREFGPRQPSESKGLLRSPPDEHPPVPRP